MSDLTYLKQGLFTVFFAENESGQVAWNELASVTQGAGKIPTIQLPQFLASLRAAGYSVREAKKRTAAQVQDDLQSLLDDPILQMLS